MPASKTDVYGYPSPALTGDHRDDCPGGEGIALVGLRVGHVAVIQRALLEHLRTVRETPGSASSEPFIEDLLAALPPIGI